MLEDHKKKFGSASTILEYQFKKGGPKFNIVAILNPDYDPKAKKDKGNHEYFLFATNLQVNSTSKFIKKIPEEYKKRWNIETGYKIKNVFKIRTCSKSPVVRILFFLIQCLLYNILYLLKSGLKTTVYELKSAISDGILTYIREGYRSLCMIPIAAFLNWLRRYNESRIQTLRDRLAQI
jgi:hypothetical protein